MTLELRNMLASNRQAALLPEHLPLTL